MLLRHSPSCRCCLSSPFLNEFLDSFHLIVLDIDLISAFTAPGVCTVVHSVLLNRPKFTSHHGLVHKHLVPGYSMPFVVPAEQIDILVSEVVSEAATAEKIQTIE